MRVWIETLLALERMKEPAVTLYVRVWIETVNKERIAKSTEVTLYVRVWIETNKVLIVFP